MGPHCLRACGHLHTHICIAVLGTAALLKRLILQNTVEMVTPRFLEFLGENGSSLRVT